jgi:sulfur-oxidizing protein SoxY
VKAGISMSEDPSVRFTFTPKEQGKLKAVIKDSKSQEFSMEKEI